MIYGGINAASRNQMGMMVLASQAQSSGIGSGQLSGVRPEVAWVAAEARSAASRLGRAGNVQSARRTGRRYFHRTTTTSRNPQIYYNQQSRYFPQIAR